MHRIAEEYLRLAERWLSLRSTPEAAEPPHRCWADARRTAAAFAEELWTGSMMGVYRVYGLGFRVSGLGFSVWGLEFSV